MSGKLPLASASASRIRLIAKAAVAQPSSGAGAAAELGAQSASSGNQNAGNARARPSASEMPAKLQRLTSGEEGLAIMPPPSSSTTGTTSSATATEHGNAASLLRSEGKATENAEKTRTATEHAVHFAGCYVSLSESQSSGSQKSQHPHTALLESRLATAIVFSGNM